MAKDKPKKDKEEIERLRGKDDTQDEAGITRPR